MTNGDREEEPLYVRDPAAWRRTLAEGNQFQARKRVAAKVILHDEQGRLLLVDPTYKPFWDLPGGMAEANESPHEAALREVREELGLDLVLGDLLCVEWTPPRDPWDDLLMFVFDGGTLTPERAADLHPVDPEVGDIGWFTPEEASQRLRKDVWARTRQALFALENKSIVYLTPDR